MKPVDITMLLLGAASFVIALLEWFNVFHFRVEPQAFVIVAIICWARVALRIKMRNTSRDREALINEVPKRPLGLMDEEPGSGNQAAATTPARLTPLPRRDERVNPMLKDVPKRPLGLD